MMTPSLGSAAFALFGWIESKRLLWHHFSAYALTSWNGARREGEPPVTVINA